MNLGTNPITELFLGGSPIKSIWLGTTKVWEHTYDYEIKDIKLVYSDGGTYLKCDASNYAYISCTLTKKNGTSIESTETKKLDFDFTFAGLGDYFDKGEDGTIRFSLSKYGTKDMSYHSNPFTVGLTPYFGDTQYSSVYFNAEPNVETSSSSIGYKIYAKDIKPINATTSYFYLYGYCYEILRKNYKSGKTGATETEKNWYLYPSNIIRGPYDYSGSTNQRVTVECGTNPNAYPLIRSYRLGYIGVSSEDMSTNPNPPSSLSNYDYYIDVLQKSTRSYSSAITQSLFYGMTELTDDYTIFSSTDLIIANDAHKDEIVYEFKCSDNTINIEQKNGIIYVKGLASTTDCWFEVTTYIPKHKEEWWQDEPEPDKTIMTYNIYGS